MAVLGLVMIVIISYLIGSVNSSIIISRILGVDIRTQGSGNAGATNMLRTHGKKMGVLTLVIDLLKGVLAVGIGIIAFNIVVSFSVFSDYAHVENFALDFKNKEAIILYLYRFVAGICVMLGHNFPIFFGFKGGKGVATSTGVILMLNWQIALIVIVIAVAIMAISGYVSLGSILAPVIYIILVIVGSMYFTDLPFNFIWLAFGIVVAVVTISKHIKNIKRLLNGTESNLRSKERIK